MWEITLPILLGVAALTTGQQLDILAFNYYRKFGHDVHLGDCPDVTRLVGDTKNTERVRCHLKQSGPENFQRSEIVHEAVLAVESPRDIFSNLGLCDGYSVSRLGLLYNSECITVDIAKAIPSDEKSYNRAFFGTYRRGMVVLGDTPSGDTPTPSTADNHQFYTKYITYGSKEMVLVSLRYKYEADASSAKKIEFISGKLSDQLETLLRDSNNIEDITIYRVSTADRKYSTWYFPRALAAGAVARVADEKRGVEEVKMRVLSDVAMDPYYMNYVMWPFSGQPQGGAMRQDSVWQNVTMCEIHLHHLTQVGQEAHDKKCSGASRTNKFCKRLRRRLLRVQRSIDRDIHPLRSKWFQLTSEDKETAAAKCSRICRTNESKMDRSVNRVMMGPAPEPPVVGASLTPQSHWLKKWSERQQEKMNGHLKKRNKNKKGRKSKRKNRKNKRRKNKRS